MKTPEQSSFPNASMRWNIFNVISDGMILSGYCDRLAGSCQRHFTGLINTRHASNSAPFKLRLKFPHIPDQALCLQRV